MRRRQLRRAAAQARPRRRCRRPAPSACWSCTSSISRRNDTSPMRRRTRRANSCAARRCLVCGISNRSSRLTDVISFCITHRFEAAEDAYERASRLGNAEAKYRLGLLYSKRRVPNRDRSHSIPLWTEAAAANHVNARCVTLNYKLRYCMHVLIVCVLHVASQVRARSVVGDGRRAMQHSQGRGARDQVLYGRRARRSQSLVSRGRLLQLGAF